MSGVKKSKGDIFKKIIKTIADYIIVLIGTSIFAFGVYAFTAPASIAPGGVAGISTIINHVSGISIGILYAIINIPLIIVGFIMLSKRLMIRSLISVATFTLMLDYIYPLFMPEYNGDGILSSIFGGIVLGIGLGIVYSKEATTGGTDIVNRIILKFFPYFKIGQITFFTDTIIIISAMLVFRDINAGLYAIIVIFCQGRMIDKLVYGGFEAKLLTIFTDKPQEISKIIMKMGRGATIVDGKGAYSGNNKNVLYTVVQKNQYFKFKKLIRQTDPNVFLTVSSVNEVLGTGFKEFKE